MDLDETQVFHSEPRCRGRLYCPPEVMLRRAVRVAGAFPILFRRGVFRSDKAKGKPAESETASSKRSLVTHEANPCRIPNCFGAHALKQ